MGSDTANRPEVVDCTFCAKTREEVALLIAGPPGVSICNECIALCVEICMGQLHKNAQERNKEKKASDVPST